MKRASRYNRAAIFLFSLTLSVFFAFFVYMGTAERVSVYQAEQAYGYGILDGMQLELVSDDTAPAGIQKVYRGTLTPEWTQESFFCFRISHHNIQVYFDDTLVYSLTGAESNRIGKNVNSNWCSVRVGREHAGQEVTVILTPLFESAISKTPVFLLGSHYAIAMDVLTDELPLLIFSSLCILLGLFVFAVFLYFRYITKTKTNGMNYLGLFSVTLGLWKLTDLRCMPLLIPQHSMALGYISIGSLFLTSLCLLLYFRTLFVEKNEKLLYLLSCVSSLVCLYVLAVQIMGITEIRQNLVLSHILLIVAMVSVPAAALVNRIVHKSWGLRQSWKPLLLVVGITLDLLLYYHNNSTGLRSFTIIGLIIYTLIIFLNGVQDATRRAHTDIHTGLMNRVRWNELMNNHASVPEPYAILVVDLNGLKRVNDTLGHEAGDQMIFQLSSILRNSLPRNSVICRWGGDEFAILLTAIKRVQLDQLVDDLLATGEKYNADHPELPIHFAIGAALSTEHPGISRDELFRLADREMYRNKRQWYRQKQTDTQ